MGSFHWLHFSDLHLSPEVRFDTQYARARLFEFLREETTAGRLPCDYIFFTGDIAHKGNHDGVPSVIQQLFAALKWDNKHEHAFWAVGNHDISRKSTLRSLVIERIRSVKTEDELFEEYMEDPEVREVLLDKCTRKYSKCHKEALKREALSDNRISPHAQHLLPDLNLIVLNTCITSCDTNDEHNLYINECGLQHVLKGLNESNPTFVIGHHGKEYFKSSEQDSIGHLFDSSNVDLYLCGHSHKPGYDILSQAGRYIHQITCGGGIVAKTPSKFSFMHGHYDSENHIICIRPYSYEGNGNRTWHFDGNLHRRFDGVAKLTLTGKRTKPSAIKAAVDHAGTGTARVSPMQKKQMEWSSGFFRLDGQE